MSTLTVAAYVSRTLLGKENLYINDHETYVLTPTIMGGAVSWDKKEASSPWVDGEYTISRRKRNINEQLVINVYGASQIDLQTNIAELVEAFTQDNFGLYFSINNAIRAYKCFAADYQVSWDHTRMHALNVPVTITVPRLPNPISGI